MRIYIIMATWVTIKPCGFDVAKHLTERFHASKRRRVKTRVSSCSTGEEPVTV